jgi:hypothetical protein
MGTVQSIKEFSNTCNNPQTSPDAAVPWVGGRTVDVEALGAVPAGHSIISLSIRCRNSRPGLIGDERVTSHLLSPPPLKPDQRVQGKVRRP